MSNNHLSPPLDQHELAACFMACADQPYVPTNHNFIQYNVNLPLARTQQDDEAHLKTLIGLIEDCGLRDKTPTARTGTPEDFPSQRGEFSYQMAFTRQNHEQSARAYARRNGLAQDLGLADYLQHSGREARISVQFNIHPDDLETVKGALTRTPQTPISESELSIA